MSRRIIASRELPLPEQWRGRKVTLIDALLHMRQEMLRGRPLWLFTGEDTVQSLVSFLLGWGSCIRFNGGVEEEWSEFLDWLRDTQHEIPPEGWHLKFLADCGGDHTRAALKFLDFVHEFTSARRVAPPQQ
jgi:hypothetical protein